MVITIRIIKYVFYLFLFIVCFQFMFQMIQKSKVIILDNINTEPAVNYNLSREYWKNQEASVNSMLGGYDYLSDNDISHSQQFLNFFLNVCLK